MKFSASYLRSGAMILALTLFAGVARGQNVAVTASSVAPENVDAAKDERKARREHVMGQVMVMLLDEKLALTTSQRPKLEPLADRLVKNIPQLFPEDARTYNFVPSDLLYNATLNAKDAELKPILDPIQLKRWHQLATLRPGNDLSAVNAPTSNDNKPEDVEKAVSAYLYEKTKIERERELDANTLKAEDVARTAGVNAETTEHLEAAAAGATEQALMTWKWFTEQQIRSQLQGLTPQNVRQRLQSLQDFLLLRSFPMFNQDDIWAVAVQTELTAPQQAAWRKETDARADYRENAIASVVLAEFDRQAHLTQAQWDQLHPLVTGVLNDYGGGITQIFSSMNGMPWYLGGPYTLIPIMGVDDKTLQSILTKDQMDLWTDSPQFANSSNLWQVIRQIHAPGQGVRHTFRVIAN